MYLMCSMSERSIASFLLFDPPMKLKRLAGLNLYKTPDSEVKRVPSEARSTLQKYSPSSSLNRRESHGPAASASSRLVSHVPVCMWRFSFIFLKSHSTGVRSSQSELRTN